MLCTLVAITEYYDFCIFKLLALAHYSDQTTKPINEAQAVLCEMQADRTVFGFYYLGVKVIFKN